MPPVQIGGCRLLSNALTCQARVVGASFSSAGRAGRDRRCSRQGAVGEKVVVARPQYGACRAFGPSRAVEMNSPSACVLDEAMNSQLAAVQAPGSAFGMEGQVSLPDRPCSGGDPRLVLPFEGQAVKIAADADASERIVGSAVDSWPATRAILGEESAQGGAPGLAHLPEAGGGIEAWAACRAPSATGSMGWSSQWRVTFAQVSQGRRRWRAKPSAGQVCGAPALAVSGHQGGPQTRAPAQEVL